MSISVNYQSGIFSLVKCEWQNGISVNFIRWNDNQIIINVDRNYNENINSASLIMIWFHKIAGILNSPEHSDSSVYPIFKFLSLKA